MNAAPQDYYAAARRFLRQGTPRPVADPVAPAGYWLAPPAAPRVVAPTNPPRGTRGSFRDDFANANFERYWRRLTGTWTETTASRLSISSVSANFPAAQLVTWGNDYRNVDIFLNVSQKASSGANRVVFIIAAASGILPDPLTSYLWQHDMQTGSWQLDRYDAGLGNALAIGNIGLTTAPLTMRLVNNAGTLTGYINGVDLTGPVVDGTPLPAGRVGIGSSRTTVRFDLFTCDRL